MKRVYVVCEGQTEEVFVKRVLMPTFVNLEIYLAPKLIEHECQFFAAWLEKLRNV